MPSKYAEAPERSSVFSHGRHRDQKTRLFGAKRPFRGVVVLPYTVAMDSRLLSRWRHSIFAALLLIGRPAAAGPVAEVRAVDAAMAGRFTAPLAAPLSALTPIRGIYANSAAPVLTQAPLPADDRPAPAAASAAQERLATNDMSDPFRRAGELARSGGNILMAFDLDNTVLTTNQVLGGEPWTDDMVGVLLPLLKTDPALFSKRIAQLLDDKWDSILKDIARQKKSHLTEDEIPEYMRQASALGVKMIALTARSTNVVEATRTALTDNGIDFDRTKLGADIPTVTIPGGKHDGTYTQGQLMAFGGNKGEFLAAMLKRQPRAPDVVIYVDNKQSEGDRVAQSLQSGGVNLIAYRYGRMDWQPAVHTSPEYRAAARVQFKTWHETGRIIGDAEALETASRAPVSQEEVNLLIYGAVDPLKP